MNNFNELFSKQILFQTFVLDLHGEAVTVPSDSLEWFTYHMNAMQEELGEVLKADKRWKTHRNTRYVPEEKLDEIADVFITAMNIAMYSGFDANDIFKAISGKIDENIDRIQKEICEE